MWRTEPCLQLAGNFFVERFAFRIWVRGALYEESSVWGIHIGTCEFCIFLLRWQPACRLRKVAKSD